MTKPKRYLVDGVAQKATPEKKSCMNCGTTPMKGCEYNIGSKACGAWTPKVTKTQWHKRCANYERNSSCANSDCPCVIFTSKNPPAPQTAPKEPSGTDIRIRAYQEGYNAGLYADAPKEPDRADGYEVQGKLIEPDRMTPEWCDGCDQKYDECLCREKITALEQKVKRVEAERDDYGDKIISQTRLIFIACDERDKLRQKVKDLEAEKKAILDIIQNDACPTCQHLLKKYIAREASK